MPWVELFAIFVVCHTTGDFLLQTNWQATHKWAGLGTDAIARRALFAHIVTYGVAFVPALVWIGEERSLWWAVAVGALITVPHVIQDDGRLLSVWARSIKGLDRPDESLLIALDQSFHLLALFAVALVAA